MSESQLLRLQLLPADALVIRNQVEEQGGAFMIVGVPREMFPGERRVALVPAVVPTLKKAGVNVVVEAGAGVEAGYPDAGYAEKGAKIVASRAEVFGAADIVVQVLCYGSNDKTGKGQFPFVSGGPVP